MGYNMNDYVKCEECGKLFKRVTHNHLKQHNITLDEYKSKYPDAELISDTTRQKFSTNRLEFWIEKYGVEIGAQRYKEYTNFLGEKNTFEYKQSKYGWTREQFDEFNQNRAQTLLNMVSRYGQEEGTRRWELYCEKQRYVGSTLQYFVDVYGTEEGTQRWTKICTNKSHSLDLYIARYGDELGYKKYNEYASKVFSITRV